MQAEMCVSMKQLYEQMLDLCLCAAVWMVFVELV